MHYRNMVHISIFLRVWSGPVNTFLMFRFYRSSQICAMSSVQYRFIAHRTTGLEGCGFFSCKNPIQVEKYRIRLWILILKYTCMFHTESGFRTNFISSGPWIFACHR